MRRKAVVLFALLLAAQVVAVAQNAAGSKVEYYPLEEVRTGQKGVARTVFSGAEPQEFGLEVLGVLPGFPAPRKSVIIARLSGAQVERTSVFAGMSGSPVYIDGKLVGAIAYAFPFAKEPIAGITPIKQMVAMVEQRRQSFGAQGASQGAFPGPFQGEERRPGRMTGRVADVMARDVRIANPEDSVQQAARLMRDEDTGVLPVGEGDRLVGMVTDRDVALRLVADGRDPAQTKVRDVMTNDVLYVFEDEPVSHVAENMAERQVRRMPVVNRDKRLVGIVSIGDLKRRGRHRESARALAGVTRRSA